MALASPAPLRLPIPSTVQSTSKTPWARKMPRVMGAGAAAARKPGVPPSNRAAAEEPAAEPMRAQTAPTTAGSAGAY